MKKQTEQKSRRKKSPVVLPECGLLIGSSVYVTQADYLTCSGRIHTTWVPQSFSPETMLQKIIQDNQGNFALLWGVPANRPLATAYWCGLDKPGVLPPEPDWEKRRHLTIEEWPAYRRYEHRYGAGMLNFVKEAARTGIYSAIIYARAKPAWSRRLKEAGQFYLGYNYGEKFSFGLSHPYLSGKNLSRVTLEDLAERLKQDVQKEVKHRRAAGWGRILSTSSSFHLDYEILAGTDIPVVEDFAFSHLNFASALARGLYRQYRLPLWGAHLAHEHYSWIPYRCRYKFDLLASAMFLKYLSGCKLIVNESGNWFLQASLCPDSPMFKTPRVELGGIFRTDPHLVAPYVKLARKYYRHIDYESPICRRYRKVISDFYDFVKAHGTPKGQPETTLAIAKGNLDLCHHQYHPNFAVAGAYQLADLNRDWFEGAPEKGWEIVRKVFFPRPPVLAPYHNRFLSGTPYGMVDIVSFAGDNISADFLIRHYRTLIFAGWNTCSEKQYEVLTEFVRHGGRLFISIPHLSTNKTRNYTSYTVKELVRAGDFSELCGLRVRGRGRRVYWATGPDRKGPLGFGWPRRFGIMATPLGEIELVDPEIEVLVVEDEETYPVLLRRRLGRGEVFFLNSWAYPGALEADEGPGGTIDSPGLIGVIYRYLAELSRGKVWISDDRKSPGRNCQYIAYSFFPEDGTICLLNIDFRKKRRFFLHQEDRVTQVYLAPAEFRRIKDGEVLSVKNHTG
ncbi:MAG TPA: hypothetical protein PKX93_04185 [bacterium]|nr:hypothetical protein [bacterium]